MMKVKIFQADGRDDIKKLEAEINGFLATLPTSTAVRHTETATCQVADRPDGERWQYVVITLWYDDGNDAH